MWTWLFSWSHCVLPVFANWCDLHKRTTIHRCFIWIDQVIVIVVCLDNSLWHWIFSFAHFLPIFFVLLISSLFYSALFNTKIPSTLIFFVRFFSSSFSIRNHSLTFSHAHIRTERHTYLHTLTKKTTNTYLFDSLALMLILALVFFSEKKPFFSSFLSATDQ